jgi:hypothetical protein
MEMISWTDRVKNEDLLHRVKKGESVIDKIERWKTNGLVTSYVGTAL